jgi:hypothetical protein
MINDGFHVLVGFVSESQDLVLLGHDIYQRMGMQVSVFKVVSLDGHVREGVKVAQQYHHGFWIVFLELDLLGVTFLCLGSASIPVSTVRRGQWQFTWKRPARSEVKYSDPRHSTTRWT